MSSSKRRIVIGFLGTTLDGGFSPKRWDRWRPTVGLVAPTGEKIHRIELLLNRESDMEIATKVVEDIAQKSPHTEVRIHQLNISQAWDFAEVYGALQDFTEAYDFSDAEDYLVHLATGTHVAQICLFALTESRHIPGRILSSRQAVDAKEKWWGQCEVIDLNLASYDRLASRFAKARVIHTDLLKSGIVTRNKRFNKLISQVEVVSLRSKAPILLMGPTGAGKSQLAERIHQLRHSRRQVGQNFVAVNCATLRGDAAMSTIFGHKKGAFTGAVADRSGMLMAADGGTLFLDEIGELGLDEQAMLLRAIEDGVFTPMGSDKDAKSDFQLIAGTNRDLAAEARKGTFREDLLARIDMWTYALPGLADRVEDIEPNLDYELDRCSGELNCKVSMNSDARACYLSFAEKHGWAGNFRELHSSVLRMSTLADGGRIVLEDAEMEVSRLSRGPRKVIDTLELVDKVLGARANDFDAPDLAALEVILRAVSAASTQAEAGRAIFTANKDAKAAPNFSDRAKKTLARYDLTFDGVKKALAAV